MPFAPRGYRAQFALSEAQARKLLQLHPPHLVALLVTAIGGVGTWLFPQYGGSESQPVALCAVVLGREPRAEDCSSFGATLLPQTGYEPPRPSTQSLCGPDAHKDGGLWMTCVGFPLFNVVEERRWEVGEGQGPFTGEQSICCFQGTMRQVPYDAQDNQPRVPRPGTESCLRLQLCVIGKCPPRASLPVTLTWDTDGKDFPLHWGSRCCNLVAGKAGAPGASL